MKSKVAIIMSIYKSDKLKNIEAALNSLEMQTYDNIDIFIAVDGPICSEVKSYLDCKKNNPKIYISFFDENKGLATRLNNLISIIVDEGKHDFVARMDADDISLPERISKQLNFFYSNCDIDVLGSDVIEISSSDEFIFYKSMASEHTDMLNDIIVKCPFNHPTVMFRAQVFYEGFRYDPALKNTQDYYLWVDLLVAGKKFANLNEPLLKFRIDDDFHNRRGIKKAVNEFKSRVYAFKKMNNLNFKNAFHTFKLFALRLSPAFVKKIVYSKFR